MAQGHVAEAGITESVHGVGQIEIRTTVAFPAESEHGIRPGIDAAVNATREVHAEKWKLGVGRGIDEPLDQVLPRWNGTIEPLLFRLGYLFLAS